MLIGGLQKVTLIDYPGKVACTVFLMGCNFRCPFCYSKELVLPEEIKKQLYPHTKQGYGVGAAISEKEFFDFLRKRKGLLEGVVLCGGEPTISDDLPQFCEKIKKLGYLIKLDTNGSRPKMIEKLIYAHLIDYVAMDVKAPQDEYDFYSGNKADIKKIKKSIDVLKQGKIDFEFRTTVAPGLKKQDILEIADWIGSKKVHHVKSSLLEVSRNAEQFNRVKYFLQEFNSQKPVLNPDILKLPVLKQKEIKKAIEKVKPKFQTCKLR